MADTRPRALIVGPLPPPPGGVGMQVEVARSDDGSATVVRVLKAGA